jgi:hypothetical protein
MNHPYVFDEKQSFIELVKRSKIIVDDWRQVSDSLWNYVKTQAEKQPAIFELDEINRRIRFTPYA